MGQDLFSIRLSLADIMIHRCGYYCRHIVIQGYDMIRNIKKNRLPATNADRIRLHQCRCLPYRGPMNFIKDFGIFFGVVSISPARISRGGLELRYVTIFCF